MLDATEFTHPDLPGLTGLTWGGQTFTRFATKSGALDAISARSEASQFLDLRPVEASDGRWLIAAVDPEDATFFYIAASQL